MKKGMLILVLGVVSALILYACIYHSCTASVRALERKDVPELAWLKAEFKLSDQEFKEVVALHEAYLPQCHEMCRKIDAQNDELQKLLANATGATPEIDHALSEAARLRSECQQMMLRHFFKVAQTMPKEQGRRYLAWVKQKAFAANYGMNEGQ